MTGAVEGRLAEAWVRVRTLHKPDDRRLSDRLLCSGCHVPNIYFAYWPCKTAEIVFGPREIAAALAGTPPQTEDSE